MEHSVSLTTLVKASLAAVVLAVIALLTLILPAEYNIDPTGLGQTLGLTVLAQSAEALPVDLQPKSVRKSDSVATQQVIEITVPANEGIEYKLQMKQYDKLTYEWMTDDSSLYVDFHGEPEGDTGVIQESCRLMLKSMLPLSCHVPG